RAIARSARTRTIDQAWALLCSRRLPNHAGLLCHSGGLLLVAVVARVSRHGAAALEISIVCPKHSASRWDRVLARMVARGRRPILSLSAVHPAPCESVAARCADYSMRYRFRRARDRKSTRLNSSHVAISYAVFCLKKKIHIR